MSVRSPAVAGHFYPASDRACRSEIEACLAAADRVPTRPDVDSDAAALRSAVAAGTQCLFGGIVPHAGWMCSGAVAGEVLRELCRPDVETVVVFGAAHRLAGRKAAVFAEGGWSTPLGEIAIDEELASAVLSASQDVEPDSRAHQPEHSIEVQVPFVQYLTPSARLLPILVPHTVPASVVGRTVAEQARRMGRRTVFVGSTDLTHYGPRYDYTPKGVGPAGLAWAKDVNDRAIIDLIRRMEADQIAPEARRHQNACGAGAVAATVAACRSTGALRGVLLRHTTSGEVLRDRYGDMDDAVGYAGVVFAGPPESMGEH
ncbi:MAG: AmmeMemoRadiSam system protein B [Planctomycetes bacterium]|nr:AmmeMemoRadiSam system protein B [Planctomycetota bacterium]